MKDINGIEIEIGMTVKTTQPSGGILNPAPSETGEVINFTVSWQTKPMLAIKYKRHNNQFYRHILLHGKINEVIL